MNSKYKKILLLLILLLALGLRVYKIGEIPKSITWDEAAVGYNAFSIANYGKDEYGKFLPLYFQSFGEDKQPIHIYITSIFVKVLGLSEFSIRLPVATFGVLNVLLIFFVARILFSTNVGLLSALLLAISPQNIFFSRFNHEANFALFFFMLGLLFFFRGLKKINFLLPISFLFFCLSMITYHAAEVFIPPFVFILVILYFRKIKQKIYILLSCIGIILAFIVLGILQPRLLGVTRFDQTKLEKGVIEETQIFKYTKNYFLGEVELILTQYSWHFSPQYLFIRGDKNARLSSQTGEFYQIEAFFLLLGLFFLARKKSKEGFVLMSWALIAPLPSALVAEAPHAARAMFMMGSWQIISAIGLYSLLVSLEKVLHRWILMIVCILILSVSLVFYLNNYYTKFANNYPNDWQYGMKQIVEYVGQHPEYTEVFMTNVRAQPYIFFLYYLKTPLPDYTNTVLYNNLESKNYNNVSFFGRYYFDGWDPIESFPYKGVLYIVSPSQYDGLRHKDMFDIKEEIMYPNGYKAFYIITAK